VVKAGTLSAGLCAWFLLAADVAGHAQTPASAAPISPPAQAAPQPQPAPGFVSPFEIIHTVRSAGFTVLSPPLREGTIYVLRATDFRGIPMRVVLDARTGMIRVATPTVPQAYGPYGVMPPAYGYRPYAAAVPYGSPYGSPAGYDVAAPGGDAAEQGVAPPLPRSAAVPPISRAPMAAPQPVFPPLPRPRPAVLASTSESLGMSGQANGPSGRGGSGTTAVGTNQTGAGLNAGAKSPAAAPSRASPVPPLTINN
jgi:hypothetical protein